LLPDGATPAPSGCNPEILNEEIVMKNDIEFMFMQTYVYKTYLKDYALRAEANYGAVTLTGSVPDESYKALAHETMANLPGVTSVDNQLATAAEVAAENEDTWIGRKVKLALLFYRNVNYGKTIVEVKDKVVTLKGEASSTAQKELTSEYARDIEGVVEVRNEMTVTAVQEQTERTEGQKIDDASVAAQVKTALLTHRSTSAVRTKTEVRDGDVTLTGIAMNEAEKALVTKLVNDIQGVSSVKNMMTVGEPKTK